MPTPDPPPARARGRAFRGLALVFVLTFLSLVGVVLTATALGGLEPWSPWQFVGLFGVVETAAGLANVLTPNLWRLPIAQLETSRRTDVALARSIVLLPHWGGLARAAAGLVCVAIAAAHDGLAPASAGLVPLVAALAVAILAISALLARAGVATPERDVVQLVVRWGGRERALQPVSVGAAVFQFLLSVTTIPAAKLFDPGVLYRPELAPSPAALAAALGAAAATTALALASWSGRSGLEAPAEQQREAEEHA